MKLIKNLLLFIIALAMLVLGALFAAQNTAAVPLDLLVVYLPERSVALWVLLAFAIGGVIGMLTNIGLVLRLRTALLKSNRQLARLEQAAQPAVQSVAAGEETSPDSSSQTNPKETHV